MLKSALFDQHAFVESQSEDDDEMSRRVLALSYKNRKLSRLHSLSRSKNSCAFSGKSRTFNRQLFVSRQVMRSLTRFGLISGLISGKRG